MCIDVHGYTTPLYAVKLSYPICFLRIQLILNDSIIKGLANGIN